jgi:hypothetical protein
VVHGTREHALAFLLLFARAMLAMTATSTAAVVPVPAMATLTTMSLLAATL